MDAKVNSTAPENSGWSSHLPEEKSRVSVVVPSYNHARFVGQCLRSIFKQTLLPAQVVVIDDGSSDDSPKIIEGVLKDCPVGCEFIQRPNRGLATTLNEGFARADRGSYFAYLGSDDLWLPEFLAARVQLLQKREHAVLAYGNAYSIDEANNINDCTTDWALYQDGDVRRMLVTTLAPLSPTVVYRRSALAHHVWNESAALEDYELYLRLSSEGDFAFDPSVLSAWRQHDTNASSNLTMMLRERLAAQQLVGSALGLSPRELENYRSLATFRSAQEFMRRGQKLRALELTRKSFHAVPSLSEAIRMFAGLLAPRPLLNWRKLRRRQAAQERYGSLEI